jgi:hypothetical protein
MTSSTSSRRRLRRCLSATAGSALIASGTFLGTAGPAFAASPVVTNLGVAVDVGSVNPSGGLVAFMVSESDQALDLNGDGDTDDHVVHAYDSSVGMTNLGLAGDPVPGFMSIDGGVASFNVSELAQGTDLNGDGDMADFVVHVYDSVANTTTNLGLATPSPGDSIVRDGFVGFPVSEASQGGTDLNSDGDASDDVVHLHDVAANSTTNLGLATSEPTVTVNDGFAAFTVNEADQGTDLNSDGDTTDDVMHVCDGATATTDNLELAAVPSGVRHLGGGVLVFSVREANEGVDKNGDGDTTDFVAHADDTTTGTVSNLGVAVGLISGSGGVAAFAVPESAQDADLNGDGDKTDGVVHVYDAAVATTTNLGLAAAAVRVSNGFVAVMSSEPGDGTDYNGDGDASDFVIQVYDVAASSTTNLGLAISALQVDGGPLALVVDEADQGVDLNGDADTTDGVAHVYDLGSAAMTNLGLAATGGIRANGDLVGVSVVEADQGVDENGDGDISDLVAHVYDHAAGTTSNLGVAASSSISVGGGLAAWLASESDQDNSDLNGDGDSIDEVVHVYGSPPPDPDSDGDGLADGVDNCPAVPNVDQLDSDGDLSGDACDADDDGDGDPDVDDAFPLDPTESADTDGDGVGDNADAFPDDADETADADSDGIGDNSDNCPAVANTDQADTDGDGIGNVCDLTPTGEPTTVTYNGQQYVSVGSALTPAARLSSTTATCISGKVITFSIDPDPDGAGPIIAGSLATATTDATGQATKSPVLDTSTWAEGTYAITATSSAGSGCGASTDTAALTTVAKGAAASAGGTYNNLGRFNVGFTVRAVPKSNPTVYKGQLLWIHNGKWRLKGTLYSYGKTGTTGVSDGRGDLYSLNGSGVWVLSEANVGFRITFTDAGTGKKATADTFGISITVTNGQAVPTATPPVTYPLKGGDIKVG